MNYKLKNLLLSPFNFLYDYNPKLVLKILFRLKNGYKLRLDKPETYNEKLQWIKLNDKNDLMPVCCDKFTVREYVSECGCSNILNDLIWEGFKPEEIPFHELPNEFVIKVTHGSGFNIICTNKSDINPTEIIEQLNSWLDAKFIKSYGEWFYGVIKPRIIIEKYLKDSTNKVPVDYKIMCFDGIPKYIFVDTERFVDHRRNVYDTSWNFMKHVSFGFKNDKPMEKPENLEEMLEYAKKLSSGFRHARVDLYSVENEIYFGEITFTNGAGFDKIYPYEFDLEMGSYINLK